MSGTTIADESFETATSLPARAGSGLPGEGDVATDQCDRRKHCADLAPIHRPCMRPGAQSGALYCVVSTPAEAAQILRVPTSRRPHPTKSLNWWRGRRLPLSGASACQALASRDESP